MPSVKTSSGKTKHFPYTAKGKKAAKRMAKKTGKSVSYETNQRIVVFHGAERFLIEEHTRRFIEALSSKFGGIEQFHFEGTAAGAGPLVQRVRASIAAVRSSYACPCRGARTTMTPRDSGAWMREASKFGAVPMPKRLSSVARVGSSTSVTSG